MQATVSVPAEPDAPLIAEHPLIDIDHTIWIQLVLFLVVAFLGSRLLFRPYLRMRDERAAGIEGAREESVRLSAEADARLADYEEKVAQARSRAQDERRKVRAQAATEQREITEKARSEAAAALEVAKKRIVEQTEKARAELGPRATQIAGDIASKLLDRKVVS